MFRTAWVGEASGSGAPGGDGNGDEEKIFMEENLFEGYGGGSDSGSAAVL